MVELKLRKTIHMFGWGRPRDGGEFESPAVERCPERCCLGGWMWFWGDPSGKISATGPAFLATALRAITVSGPSGHFPSEFSSNPNQTHLNQLIIVFKTTRRLQGRWVVSGLEQISAGKWPGRAKFAHHRLLVFTPILLFPYCNPPEEIFSTWRWRFTIGSSQTIPLLRAIDDACNVQCQACICHTRRMFPRSLANSIHCDVDENLWSNPRDRVDTNTEVQRGTLQLKYMLL